MIATSGIGNTLSTFHYRTIRVELQSGCADMDWTPGIDHRMPLSSTTVSRNVFVGVGGLLNRAYLLLHDFGPLQSRLYNF